jgi:hypothetical protein
LELKEDKLKDKKDLRSDEHKLINGTKLRGVPSSKPIAVCFTAYAHIHLIPFKNDPNNKMLYSDTDSILIEKMIANDLISSSELGKFKLEHKVIEGYFIHPKFYTFKKSEGKTIIKSKGVNSKNLTFDDFLKQDKVENLTIENTIFSKKLSESTVKTIKQSYHVPGRKTLKIISVPPALWEDNRAGGQRQRREEKR